MTNLSTALVPVTAPIESPTSAREALADRFLARVSALSPRQWGELDAIGQRFTASDPISVWQRARRLAAFAGRLPALEDVMTVFGFVGLGVADLATAAGLRGRTSYVHLPTPATSTPPESRALTDRIETLRDIATHQPGGAGEAFDSLAIALGALWMRDLLPDASFARLYALVEPVVPIASL